MRRLPFFTLVMLLMSPAALHAADITAESTITAATVYANRATVTRKAEIDVPAGAHKVIINNLPARLMPDSLRVKGESTGGSVTFGALSHKVVAQAELAAERERILTDKLEALQHQQRLVQAEKEAMQARKSFLESLGKQAGLREDEEIAKLNLNADQWRGAADTIYAGIGETLKGMLEQDKKARALTEDISAVQRELNQIRTGQRQFYRVTIPLEASAPSKLTMELSYQLYGASWKPLYDARLDTQTGALELVQYGAVRQTTGEDWDDIALTLSTAQPHRGAGLPDLNPVWLDLHSPRPMPGRAARMQTLGMTDSAGAPASMPTEYEMALEEVAPRKESRMAQAQIETGGFVSEYKITGPSTVKSDGTESKLMVGGFETANRLEIQIKPQLSTDAFLVAKTTIKGEAPILPGAVNLFRDGAYIGQSRLPLLSPGDEQDLAFGVDDQVEVERRVLKDKRSEAGVISKDHVLEKAFLTRVKNLHTDPVNIAVLETVPTARDKKINVEILGESTTPGYQRDVDDIKGLLKWAYELRPGEERKIGLGWRVSWPKGENLSGL